MWKLLAPIYTVLVLSVILAFWVYGGAKDGDLTPWTLLYLTPAFIPFFSLGNKRWNDGQDGRQ
jgi:hypothetical protein